MYGSYRFNVRRLLFWRSVSGVPFGLQRGYLNTGSSTARLFFLVCKADGYKWHFSPTVICILITIADWTSFHHVSWRFKQALHWTPCSCFIVSLRKFHQGKRQEPLLLTRVIAVWNCGWQIETRRYSLVALGRWLWRSSACQASMPMEELGGYGCPRVITVLRRHRPGSSSSVAH